MNWLSCDLSVLNQSVLVHLQTQNAIDFDTLCDEVTYEISLVPNKCGYFNKIVFFILINYILCI